MCYIAFMADPVLEETEQTTLLDTSGKKFNAYWVDEKQDLFIPNNPLHFKAHKLQVLLSRLDKQLEKNPAQFNATVYKTVLDEYTKCVEAVKNGETDVPEPDSVANTGDGGSTPPLGAGNAPGVDPGVSADNPIAG